MNPEVAASYSQTVKGMQYQGKSGQEAEQMAAMSAKGSVQVQATLSAVKEMSGWTFYGCMACAVFSCCFLGGKENWSRLLLQYLKKEVVTSRRDFSFLNLYFQRGIITCKYLP